MPSSMHQNTKDWAHERIVPSELAWYNKQTLLDHVARYQFAAKYVQNKKILDIACGSGYGSQLLAQYGAKSVKAIDLSPQVISYAKQHYSHQKIKYSIGNAQAIPLKDNSIDIAVSFETLEHVKNYQTFTKELTRVLKPRGILLISTPNSLLGSLELNPHHVKEFSQTEFSSLLAQHFSSQTLFGQKPMHARYLSLVNQCTSKLPPGFIRWSADTGLKIFFRGSQVRPIDTFKYGFVPAFFIAVCQK